MAKNGKGDGRGGRSNRSGRTRTRMQQAAANNVALQDSSQVNLLNQQLQQAQQDYLRSQQAAQSIYGGFQDTLSQLPRPQFDQIGQDFNTALGTVKDMFGGGDAAPYMAPGESAAGTGLGNAYGEAGATMLANAAAREGAYRSSAAREGNLSQRYAQDNLLQNMQDTLQSYNNQLGQVTANDPYQIQNEYDRLRQAAVENRLAQSQIQGNAATSKWLENYLGGLTSNPGGGNDGGGNGGGGGGGGNGGGGNVGGGGGNGGDGKGGNPPWGFVGRGGHTPGITPPTYDTPWHQVQHPMTQYVTGGLQRGIHELPDQKAQWLRDNIQQYYSRGHQNQFDFVHPPQGTPPINQLIRAVQRYHYNGAQ